MPRKCLLTLVSILLCQTACATLDARPEVIPEAVLREDMARLDFDITGAIAHDRTNREFTLAMTSPPAIEALGNHMYRIAMIFLWDPRSGRPEKVPLTTRFHYDGERLTFFNDENENHRIDANEPRVQHPVTHTSDSRELVLSIQAEVIDNAPWYDLDLLLAFKAPR